MRVVEYFGVLSKEGKENMVGMGSKDGLDRILQHGEELIDVCFMDMADRGNCR